MLSLRVAVQAYTTKCAHATGVDSACGAGLPVETASGKRRWGAAGLMVRWNEAEIQQLRELVLASGTGEWQAKADQLGTGRSAGSVAQRWQLIREGSGAAGVSGGPTSKPVAPGDADRGLKEREILRRARTEGARIFLEQDNPKADGTKSWQRYEAYKAATTLEVGQKCQFCY